MIVKVLVAWTPCLQGVSPSATTYGAAPVVARAGNNPSADKAFGILLSLFNPRQGVVTGANWAGGFVRCGM